MSHLRLPTVLAPGMRGHAPRTSWRRPHLKSPLSPAPTSQPWLGALVILTSHLSPLRSAAPTCSLDAALPWSQKTAGCAADSGGVGRCPSFGLEAPVLCWVIGNVAEGAGGRRGQNRHVGRTGGPAVSPRRQRAARPASPRGLGAGGGAGLPCLLLRGVCLFSRCKKQGHQQRWWRRGDAGVGGRPGHCAGTAGIARPPWRPWLRPLREKRSFLSSLIWADAELQHIRSGRAVTTARPRSRPAPLTWFPGRSGPAPRLPSGHVRAAAAPSPLLEPRYAGGRSLGLLATRRWAARAPSGGQASAEPLGCPPTILGLSPHVHFLSRAVTGWTGHCSWARLGAVPSSGPS